MDFLKTVVKTTIQVSAALVVAELTAIGANALLDDGEIAIEGVRKRVAPEPVPQKKGLFGKKVK